MWNPFRRSEAKSSSLDVLRAFLMGSNTSSGQTVTYDRALGDADIARLAAYLRRTRTTLPPWPDLDAKVAAVRKEATAG